MFRNVYAILVFIVFASLSPFAHGQDAQIQGQILDTGGAAIAGAAISISDQQTGTARKVGSNESGHYIVPGLAPGQYKIIVEAKGFSTAVSNVITLNVLQNAVFDFKLRVGAASSEVVVNADNLNINTTYATVSTVIDRQFVENLPLNGRSFQSLLYMIPGVTTNITSNSGFSQGQFVVNGQRGDVSYWTVDGVGANVGISLDLPGAGLAGGIGATDALGGTSALVSVDALQEFRVQTSTYAPEFGRGMGGQISIETRSGTNQFHGTLFDYLRNGDLDATDWFADNQGLPKPKEIQNDFGGVLGGPIYKNKTFFFFSAEALRLRTPETYISTVPDLASRAAAIPAVQPYINAFPKPKPGVADDGDGYVPYSATFSDPSTSNAFSLRIDHQLPRNISVFGRFNYAPSSSNQRGGHVTPANTLADTKAVTKTATVGTTWAITPNLNNELRYNYSVSGGKFVFDTDSFDGGTPLPDLNMFGGGLTYANSNLLTGFIVGAVNMGQALGLFTKDYQRQNNVVEALSIQKGAHTIKLGADYRHLSPKADNGVEQVIPLFDTIANFAAGKSFLTYDYLNSPQTFVLNNLGVFAQDSWRLSHRLNLTYGLRWDVDFVPTNTRGYGFAAVTGFSTTNLANLALAPLGTKPYSTRYGNVAPRVGAAYQMLTSPDFGLTLRGGFGVFYGLASTEIFNRNYQQAYYPLGAYDVFSDITFPLPSSAILLPALEAPNATNQGTLGAFDPHLNVPYALQWSIALEQGVGSGQTFSLSYVGAADKRLLLSEFVTNPNPTFASANLTANAGNSNYQALQVQFQRRLMKGLQTVTSYTWSHSFDTGSYGAYVNGTLGNVNANRGSSDFDTRNLFSGAVTYQIPTLARNFATRAVTGGWSLDNVVQIHSGTPIDIQDSNFVSIASQLVVTNSSIVIRPDRVQGQPLYLTGSKYPGRKILNRAAFTDPPVDPITGNPTRQGNLPRNVVRALGLSQWDFAVHREFPIHENLRLQFRAELFNVLNHPNFAPFDNQFVTGNPFFGQSTQMLNQFLGAGIAGLGNQTPLYAPGGPRSGQLALKLVF
jgi:Carboxypeptidase regulatory-like domain/TonB dependent receptor-like, beta-barrel